MGRSNNLAGNRGNWVDRPGDTGDLPRATAYALVDPFKWGADTSVAGLDGKRVRMEGTLVYRDGQVMLEVVPDSVRAAETGADPRPPVEALGTFTLRGEIVDSKCFLGVMNPGDLKPHRACAARCISGGIPPVLVTRAADGSETHFVLCSLLGEPVNEAVLPFVAEPVEVSGRLAQDGSYLLLSIDPALIRRL